jgi:hypothetical protein
MRSEDRETATESLLASLRDPLPDVRIASAQALAGFREARAIPILARRCPKRAITPWKTGPHSFKRWRRLVRNSRSRYLMTC